MKFRFREFFVIAAFAVFAILSLSSCESVNYQDGKYGEEKPAQVFDYKFDYDVDNLNLEYNEAKKAKNIILMIGDGMGFNQFHALHKLNSASYIKQIPSTAFSKTSNVDKKTTDSAAGGTALSTGQKTKNKKVALGPNDEHLETILEIASKNGKATGLVATSSITHATPASFIAHRPLRDQYEDIALDISNSNVDVLIGGGKNNFDKREDGANLIEVLVAKSFNMAYSIEDMDKVEDGKLAAFLYEDHPPRYNERGNMLPKASKKAVELLSKDEDGFFLMIEGSQIDWAAHENNMDYMLGETVDFDKAVGEVLKWAKNDGNTLVIVTADHETGAFMPLNFDNKRIEYAFSSKSHSDSPVPIFAYGPGSSTFNGFIENTEIFNLMIKAFFGEKD
jgi:alkaline phosphatase